MSVIELQEQIIGRGFRYDLLGTLHAGWRAMLRHREQRRTIIALSRMSPRALRDMGIDPERIYETLDGTWDEVDPVNYRRDLPRIERI